MNDNEDCNIDIEQINSEIFIDNDLNFSSNDEKKEIDIPLSKKQYFDIEVQKMIIKYQSETDKRKKDKIYSKHISPAFSELVDSLVVVYNFKSSNEDLNHLKNDCISFLFETINKYDASKGTKAFSYFNVVAKNWLIIQSRKLLKHKKRSAYIDDEDFSNEEKNDFIEKTNYIDTDINDLRLQKKLNFQRLIKVLDHVDIHLKDEKDKKCATAIREMYMNIKKIEFFNKRAVFVYLREISGLNSNELSMSLSNIRKIYRKKCLKDKYYDLSKKVEF